MAREYKENYKFGDTDVSSLWKWSNFCSYPEISNDTRYDYNSTIYGWYIPNGPQVKSDNRIYFEQQIYSTSTRYTPRNNYNAMMAEHKNLFFTGGTMLFRDFRWTVSSGFSTWPNPYTYIDLGPFIVQAYNRPSLQQYGFQIYSKNKNESYIRDGADGWAYSPHDHDLIIHYDPREKFVRIQYGIDDYELLVTDLEPFESNNNLRISSIHQSTHTGAYGGLCFRELIHTRYDDMSPIITDVFPRSNTFSSPKNLKFLWKHADTVPVVNLADSNYSGEDLRDVAITQVKNVTHNTDSLSDEISIDSTSSGTIVNNKIEGSMLGDIEIPIGTRMSEGTHTLTYRFKELKNHELNYGLNTAHEAGYISPFNPIISSPPISYFTEESDVYQNWGYWVQLTNAPIDPTTFDVNNLTTEVGGADDALLAANAKLVDPWRGILHLGRVSLTGEKIRINGGYDTIVSTVQLDNGKEYPLLPFWNLGSEPSWYKGGYKQKVYNENGECVVIDTRTATGGIDSYPYPSTLSMTFDTTPDYYTYQSFPNPKIVMTPEFVQKYDATGTLSDEDRTFTTNDTISFDVDSLFQASVRVGVTGKLLRPPISYGVERYAQNSLNKKRHDASSDFTQPAFKVYEKTSYKYVDGDMQTNLAVRYETSPGVYGYAFTPEELPNGVTVNTNHPSQTIAEHKWGYLLSKKLNSAYHWECNSIHGGFIVMDLGEDCYCNSLGFTSSGYTLTGTNDFRIKQIYVDVATDGDLTDPLDFNDPGWSNLKGNRSTSTPIDLTIDVVAHHVVRWQPSDLNTLLSGKEKIRYVRLDIVGTNGSEGWGIDSINLFPGGMTAYPPQSSTFYGTAVDSDTGTHVAAVELVQGDNKDYDKLQSTPQYSGYRTTLRRPSRVSTVWYYDFLYFDYQTVGVKKPAFLIQDLFENKWIGRVKINIGHYGYTSAYRGYYPEDWQLEYSLDGVTWELIKRGYKLHNGKYQFGVEDIYFEPVECRYLRLVLLTNTTFSNYPSISLFTPYELNTLKGVFEYSIDGGSTWTPYAGSNSQYDNSFVSKNGNVQKLIRYSPNETSATQGNWYYNIRTNLLNENKSKIGY